MPSLTRSQIAQECGINGETLRYYENRGLIQPPPRSPAGYRLYSKDYVTRINFIQNAQKLGFTLKEIKELLKLRVDQTDQCEKAMARARDKLQEVERKMAGLKALRKALQTLIRQCETRTPSEECPVLASLNPPLQES